MTIDHLSLSTRETEPVARTPRRGLPPIYVKFWAGFAAVAAGYLTVSALDGGILPTGPSAQAIAAADAAAEASKRAEENRRLRDALADFQGDLARVRTDLEQKGAAPDAIGALAAIEERASIETGKPIERRTSFAPPAATLPAIPAANTAGIETGSIAPPPTAVKTIPIRPQAAPAVAPVTTTAVTVPAPATAPSAAQEITFGAPVVKPAPKPFGVQLGSGSSLDQIRTAWTQLAEENSDALRALQPRYATTQTDAAGPTFDLFAGPFKSAVDARKVCKTLAARGVDCKVAPFSGDAL